MDYTTHVIEMPKLTKSEQAALKRFDQEAERFAPLRNSAGVCEIIAEGVITNKESGNQMIWLCRRCDNSLRKKAVPKFCRASGFRIAPVPQELAILNRMEARLIGLGVSFTTCVNLYCDGQEFTRGNSINYWNNAVDVVLDLPRPLSKCGIIYLKSQKENSSNIFRVRPDLLRRALCWLIDNNPLYRKVRISEVNLAALHQFDVEDNLPTITLTEEETQALLPTENHVNVTAVASIDDPLQPPVHDHAATMSIEEHSLQKTAQTCFACKTVYTKICPTCAPAQTTDPAYHAKKSETYVESNEDQADILSRLYETFELERMKMIPRVNSKRFFKLPTLVRLTIQFRNYKTVQTRLMNTRPACLCKIVSLHFFPNGEGGFNPILGIEVRTHEYYLAEYCAHLMKWHDRRYVIHSNFKFFCLNLIQRRQIDGLVRRVSNTNNETAEDNTDPAGRTKTTDKDTAAAIQILESLKPYFRTLACTRNNCVREI
ncbi:Hypothetical protein PHPALM_10082, partial [Phytophthora palmivora]